MDNAVNQTMKEVRNRYDFKGSKSNVEYQREQGKIMMLADDDMKLQSLMQIMQQRMAKRGISVKALKFGEPEKAMDGMVRQQGELIQGIPKERAKDMVKIIKNMKLKVQPTIQEEKIRVTSRDKDQLQSVIQALKSEVKDIPLQFTNYR